jgi:glycosyltransferase involved in cell wall biosynthesis
MQHGPQLIFPTAGQNGDTLRSAYGVQPGERVVLFFGLLRPSKGVSDLVDAFALLPDRQGLRLVVAGYPTKTFNVDALHAQIDRLGIAPQVSLYLGYVPNADVGPLLELGDVVVFPYRNATASGAVSAAQSLARPVVASAVGGLPEAIQDGVSGYLAKPEDPPALAAAIWKTLQDPARAAAMARTGQQDMLKNRSWPSFARGMIRAFEALWNEAK